MSKRKAFLGLIVLAAIGLIGWQVLRSQKPMERMRPTASDREGKEPSPEKQPAGNPGDKQASVPPAGAEKSSAASSAAAANKTSLRVTGNDLPRLGKISEHSQVTIPLPGGGVATGVVQLVRTDAGGLIRVGGLLTGDHRGSFSLVDDSGKVSGRVLMPQEKLAYVISSVSGGAAIVQALPLGNVICYPFPLEPRPAAPVEGGSPGPQAAPPILSSRPAATAVLYLDFDGETVTDPDWPAYASDGVTITGPTIVAPASTLSNAQITEVWNRVKEDYWPFDIDVTTDLNRYNNAPVGRRMRVIITPNDAAAPGAGGVAYVGSFTLAGSPYFYFQSDHVGWVFNSSVDGIAEAISHELGHTLGLEHDGRNPPLAGFSSTDGSYYYGHGDPSSAVGWAPIMGAGYYQKLVQWSKGQYPAADNQQDDVAIISGQASFSFGGPAYTNTVGYIADDAGNTRATAVAVNLASGAPQVTGIISTAADVDYYSFTLTSASEVTVSAAPPSSYPKQANLDVEIELQVSSGFPEANANPVAALDASITRTLSPGTYYVRVGGAGRNGSGGTDYGYDNYGSIGQYRLSIVLAAPVITSPTSASIGVGNLFSYAITATNSAGIFGATGLPAGLTIDTSTGVISGRPTVTGVFNITLSAGNASATGTAPLALTVTSAAPVAVTQSNPRQVLTLGGGTTLSVTGFSVNGSISYQWMRNGRPISGATSSSLVLASATYADNGAYWVEMTNTIGTGRSAPIFVTATPAVTQVRSWGSVSAGVGSVPASLSNAVAVSAGRNLNALTLKSDGTVVAWGANNQGQSSVPIGLSGVVAIAAGEFHALALKSDGTVVGWGNSSASQLAIPAGLTDVVAIGGGTQHSVALKTDGTVAAWGTTFANASTVPGGLSGVCAIAVGGYHTLALKQDGTVTAWGYDAYGQASVPAGLNGVVAIAAGYVHSVALKSDGTVVAWGYAGDGATSVPGGLNNVIAIGGGQRHTLALKSDGTVVGWGFNGDGETSPPAGGVGQGLAISTGNGYNLLIRDATGDAAPSISAQPVGLTIAEGQTATFSVIPGGAGPFGYQWRKNGVNIAGATSATLTLSDLTQADAGNYDVIVSNYVGSVTSSTAALAVAPLPVVTSISAPRQVVLPGGSLSLSVTATGAGTLAYQWIHNGHPIVGATSTSLPLAGITTQSGGWYVAAITDNYGTRYSQPIFVVVAPPNALVEAWGYNGYNTTTVPAGLSGVVAVAGGRRHALALKSDGTVVAWGQNALGEAVVPAGLNDVVAIAAGGYLSLALKSDGTVVRWGQNSTMPLGLTGIVAIAAGESHALAVRSDGKVFAWGSNVEGETSIPAGLSDVIAVAANSNQSLALKRDGSLVKWGSGLDTPPVGLNGTAISIGPYYALVLRSDATVGAWGANAYGQIDVPAGLTGVARIAAGGFHGLALKSDGTVAGWGSNGAGQATPPAGLSGVFAIAAGEGFSLAARDPAAPAAPSITLQPQSQTIVVGGSGTFTVTATGTPAPSYQWERLPAGGGTWSNINNGGAYSGVASAVLTISSATLAMSGDQFRCVSTNSSGADTSNAATLTVTVPLPVITEQPVSHTIAAGVPMSLFVLTSSPVPLTFQWKKDGVPISGATDAMYTLFTSQESDSGTYTVVVTNSAGSVTSNGAVLVVSGPAQFTSHPASQTIFAGQNVTFSVGITSNAPATYAWRKNNVTIPGATQSTYTITNTQPTDAGSYKVEVTNIAGTVTSNTATLTVNVALPVITTQPATQAVTVGQPASFTVAATSAAPLSYVWRKNGTPIGGATAVTYTIAATQPSDAADYSVVVTNVAGSVTSNDATLTVNIAPPVITAHPASRLITQGATAQFSITATGSPAPTYQWQVLPAAGGPWGNTADGATYGGSQTATLTVSGATAATNNGDQYRCVATNAGGSVTSNAASLSVTVNPAPIAVAAGGTFTSYLRFDGSLFGTGTNVEGQLGDGTTTNRTAPVALATGVAAVAAGTDHQLLLKADGSLWVNGYNTFGALGTNDTASRTTPVQIATGVAGIAAGHRHSLFFKNDGTLWAMGWNSTGQLGDGTATNRLTPVQVAANVIAVAGGVSHSLFLKSNGTAWAMGDNSLGQLGDGTTTNRLTPVQVATGVASISAGGYFNLLLKTDGTLWAAGFNGFGQLGDGTTTNRPAPVQVATGVRAMSGGFHHSMYLKTDGTLWSAGYNDFGQIGDGSTTHRSIPFQLATGVTGLGAGRYQGAFIKSDGSLWVVGGNNSGQLGDGTTTNRLAPVQLTAGTVSLPALVTDLTASELVNSDRVALSWNAAVGATYYEVWRSTTAQSGDAVRIASLLPGTFFEDVTATTGVLYRYWIKSANGAGVTGFGSSDTGSYGVILVAPTITAPPASQTVNVGANVTFSVTATGTAPFTYQWRKGTNPIGGATASSYAITGAAITDAGSYDVIVTNGAGSATSAAAVLTVNKLAQAITFNAPADRAYSLLPFALVATSDSGLPVTFSIVSGPATINGSDLTLTGVGTVTVRAGQAGNGSYLAAANVDRSFVVSKAVATVSLGDLAATYDGTAKNATATTSPAGLNVVLSYDGGATAPTNAGSYTVAGTISEANYQGSTTDTLIIAKAAQSITFAGPASQAYSPVPIALSATADSGLPVTFSIVSGPATVSGSNLTLNGTGPVTVRASQAGDSNRLAAPNVDRSFNSNKLSQTITFATLADRAYTTVPQALAATASSGLPVSFSLVSGPATLNGSDVTITGVGTVTVRAAQAGNSFYLAAADVDRSFAVSKAVATVTLGDLAATYDGTAKSVTAVTSPVGLVVDFTYDGGTSAPTNAGPYAIVGTVNEANYQGSANGTLVIAKADQTITFTGPANQPYSAAPVALSATASSGLAVTFTVVSGPATVAGDSLTLTGAGAVTVRATQDGDANRNAAPAVDRSFTVTANFASWRLARFTEGELLDANISGPNADPDHDGFANLLEYALGFEPKSATTTGLPHVGIEGSDWAYTYTRPADRTDVTYAVEMSTNLSGWGTGGVVHSLVSTSGGTETWRAKYPLASAANVFFRLTVTGQ